MRFDEMPYQRVTYEAVEAAYQELFAHLQAVRSEADCMAVLEMHNRLAEAMTPMDLCYIRHGMNINDPFYAAEQAYYDGVGPQMAELQSRYHRMLTESPFSAFF